ncbi:hypothetical protein [uncultured Paraglaciecola sp.]|uniref:hypothetical protein n=1 Tax=uncultured Paraglaciecola sp. TaxID=1765024 RepID=UPI00260359C2|nr:hypothetical protein [uncultured Paraglaciecola sp.]
MPFWIISNIKYIVIGLLIAAIPTAYLIGTYNGKRDCVAEVKVKQLEHEVKVRKRHEKIDKQTPYNADKSKRFEWMRQFVTDK